MTSEKLNRAVQLIKSGNKRAALPLLSEIVQTDPDDENAWLWLHSCIDKIEQKKYCIHQALRINPNNQYAHAALSKLENQVAASPKPVDSQGMSAFSNLHAQQSINEMTYVQNQKSVSLKELVEIGGIVLVLLIFIAVAFIGNRFYKNFITGASFLPPTPSPKVDNTIITSQIQDYYNKLEIHIDLSSSGMGIQPLPANMFFQISDIAVVDESISGNEATIITRIKFTNTSGGLTGGANGDALKKYFGNLDFNNTTFVEERRFLFREYESGTWRFEQELGIN